MLKQVFYRFLNALDIANNTFMNESEPQIDFYYENKF